MEIEFLHKYIREHWGQLEGRLLGDGGIANTQPDYDCAKTLFDSYTTVRSRSDMLNANAVTDDRVTGKWFFLLPY